MKRIAPDVYVEDGYCGVTVGCIVTEPGVICIDCPTLPADARAWRARLAGLCDKPVRFVILTDAHRDRILSLQYLGGTVVAHEAAWEKIKGYGDTYRQQVTESLIDWHGDASPQAMADLYPILPEITFTNQLALHKGNVPVLVQYVGGATPASVWVHLPQQNVLFTGDLVTSNTHPLASDCELGTWINLLSRIQRKEFPAKTIVPGRGSPGGKAALKPLVEYLRAMRTRVRSLTRSRRLRSDTTLLVPEFLARYRTPHTEAERALMERRIKSGLDHIFDSLKRKK